MCLCYSGGSKSKEFNSKHLTTILHEISFLLYFFPASFFCYPPWMPKSIFLFPARKIIEGAQLNCLREQLHVKTLFMSSLPGQRHFLNHPVNREWSSSNTQNFKPQEFFAAFCFLQLASFFFLEFGSSSTFHWLKQITLHLFVRIILNILTKKNASCVYGSSCLLYRSVWCRTCCVAWCSVWLWVAR